MRTDCGAKKAMFELKDEFKFFAIVMTLSGAIYILSEIL